jgi:uncharacterized membrane protein
VEGGRSLKELAMTWDDGRYGGVRGPVPARRDPAGRRWTGLVLGVALVVLALVAGLNFTFAAAVMPNLAGVDDRTFVLVMQGFNTNPVFPLSFTAALLLLLLATVTQAAFARGPAVRWVVAALVLYVVVLGITGAVHLPLNDRIDLAGDPARARAGFEAAWVSWNAVRTLVCTAALAALTRALYLHGR